MGQVAQDEAQEAEAAGWLALSEAAFRFWDNQDDAVWDRIEPQ